MAINDIEDVFQPGDIVFRRIYKDFSSKLIRIRTMSQWSHCGVIIGRKNRTVKCISAQFNKGVVVDNLREWGNKIHVLRLKNATTAQKDIMVDYCIRHVGIKYDCVGVIDFLTFQRAQAGKRWFSSELLYASMKYAGIDILQGKKQNRFVSPGDLYESPLLKFIGEI